MYNLMTAIVLVGSCFLLFFLLKSKWPGWMGIPFIVLVANIMRDLGTTPLVNRCLGPSWVSPIVGFASPQEMPASAFLVLLSTIAIGSGMIFALVFSHFSRRTRPTICQVSYSPHVYFKAWKISMIIFGVGFLCQVFVIKTVLHEVSFSEFASTRANFSAEDALESPIYYYAMGFRRLIHIGAWGLLLFSGQNKRRTMISVAALLAGIFCEVIFGGRLATIAMLLAIFVLYHYGKRRIKTQTIIKFASTAIVCLLVIQFLRFRVGTVSEAFSGVAKDVLTTSTLDETAFALRYFPNSIPFMGPGVIVGNLMHLVPTLGKHLQWSKSLWGVIVDNFCYGQSTHMGIGGEHYAPPAEHYMQFGLNGVIFIGLVLGLFYGLIFSWQKRNQKNLFLLMFATYAYVSFVASVVDGRMMAYIGGMGLSALLPIGIMAVMACFDHKAKLALFAPLGLCALCFVLKRIIAWELFDFAFALALGYAYLMSIRVIATANPAKNL